MLLSAGILGKNAQEIFTIVSEYPDLIRDSPDVEKSPVLELEAKFLYWKKDRQTNTNFLDSDVPYIHYDRLLNRLENFTEVSSKVSEESTVINYGDVELTTLETTTLPNINNLRKVVILPEGKKRSPNIKYGSLRRIVTIREDGEEVVWQVKEKLKNIELKDYEMRVSINKEIDILPLVDLPRINIVIRERTRKSFLMKNGLIRVDVTSVIMTTKNIVKPTRYEVEVEYLGGKDNLDVFGAYIEIIFKLLKGTNNLFSIMDKNLLIADVKAVLGDKSQDNTINKGVFVQARNIKKRDIRYKGIVGNTNINNQKVLVEKKHNRNKGTSYMITIKADGVRKMLIIHLTGIWLVYPPYEFNLVIPYNQQHDKIYTVFKIVILDGEMVVPKIPTNVKYLFLGFDCLVFRGKDQRGLNLLERRKFVETVSQYISVLDSNLDNLSVSLKEADEIRTVEDFIRLVNKYLDIRASLKYYEDGLMFLPIDVVYNPRSDLIPHKDRKLTEVPDTCKWKDVITIDFTIRLVEGQKIQLYSYDGKKSVPFLGTTYNPFNYITMVDHTNPMTLNLPPDTVVEYKWNGEQLTPVKIRYDKQGANNLSVAEDNWDDIMNPVTEDDIRGRSLSLVYSYFNRIKRGLYYKLGQNNVRLLDIGSGKGGDVDKWKDLNGPIIAVEPNANNRKELNRRIEINGMKDRVFVESFGGEDTVAITASIKKNIFGGKVDAISIMLSLSFFWQGEQYLDALVNTIVINLAPGGKIIFLTIDGHTLEQIFQNYNVTDLVISTAKIHLYPKPVVNEGDFVSRPVDFFLPDTIVGEQREYAVHISDLVTRLAKHKIYLREISRADKEKLLSEEAKLYSLMFSYGVFESERDGTEPEPKIVDIVKSSTIPNAMPQIPIVATIPTKRSTYLKSLPVIYLDSYNKVLNTPAIGDDAHLPLNCSWYNNLVRIAAIGEGSCFIHSILKGFYKQYQEDNRAVSRLNISASIRRDLAVYLSYPDDNFPGLTLWDTTAKGSFPRLLMQQLRGEGLPRDNSLIRAFSTDFSLSGMQHLFNSTATLGEESYSFISNSLGIDVYILRATTEDIFPHSHTRQSNVFRNAVVIIGNTSHYEVVGVSTPQGFQTMFLPNDPFLQALINRYSGDGAFNDIINAEPYNPDEVFIQEFVNTLIENGKLIRPDIFSIFPQQDPFIKTITRLWPRISEYITKEPTMLDILEMAKQNGFTRSTEILVALEDNPDISGSITDIIQELHTKAIITQQEKELLALMSNNY